MKITIWVNESYLETLNNFIKNNESLPEDFSYWLDRPSSHLEGIYVVRILLSLDDYVRLKDY